MPKAVYYTVCLDNHNHLQWDSIQRRSSRSSIRYGPRVLRGPAVRHMTCKGGYFRLYPCKCILQYTFLPLKTSKNTRMWANANVMIALPNIGVQRRKVWLTPAAGVPCSNAANIGERKIWRQSEFCTWQNSIMGQEPPKMYT